ncbi:MAG: hypothetical protein Q9182_003445 [Xanthomendoza sp. 2 TL-2023]
MSLLTPFSHLASIDLESKANSLVQVLCADYACETPKSSLTGHVYNTAWVSMIRKSSNGVQHWLFPQAFDFVLERQLEDGSWQPLRPSAGPGHCVRDIDSIVNTLGALVALLFRQETGDGVPEDLEPRIRQGDAALRKTLQSWDITSSDTVGFELIVPAHLKTLEKYNLRYDFPARSHLMKIHQQRVGKLSPEYLYGNEPSTLLHSLETMVGQIDFDRLAHHQVHGGIFSSPSSTAAYLMNTSVWSVDAEDYLRKAMGSGAAPESYPTNIFEISWAVKALIEAFPKDVIMSPGMIQIVDFLEHTIQAQTPGMNIDDADDTSGVIYILNYLGREVSPKAMISHYESTNNFRCFAVERTPSPDVNAHILKALLHVREPSKYSTQIIKIVEYICECWLKDNIICKWVSFPLPRLMTLFTRGQNMTPHYPMMLFSQSFMMLLEKWDRGALPHLPKSLLRDKMLLVIFGIVVETLQRQNNDGSWGFRSCETTAYAVITLSAAAALPLCDDLRSQMELSIHKGRTFLLERVESWGEPDLIWGGKVVYGIGILAEAYTIAAMNMTSQTYKLGKVTDDLCRITRPSLKTIQKITTLPFFADMPDWLARACVVEGHLHLLSLNNFCQSIATHNIKQQLPFTIVSFAVIASGRSRGASLTPDVSFSLMVFTALVFYIDHYMEDIIGALAEAKIKRVEQIVRQLFGLPSHNCHFVDHQRVYGSEQEQEIGRSGQDLDMVRVALHRGITWALEHPKVLSSSEYDRALTRRELAGYYLGQITSIVESFSFAAHHGSHQNPACKKTPPQTYHKWLHNTAADPSGAPATFAFLICLLNPWDDGQDCFPGAEAKYLVQDLSLHVAMTGRIENDIGSITRDRLENSLNSADFPEFDTRTFDGKQEDEQEDLQSKLQRLRRLAGYERECYRRALERLEGLDIHDRVIKGLRAFCNFLDLMGQVYAMEDPGLRSERES